MNEKEERAAKKSGGNFYWVFVIICAVCMIASTVALIIFLAISPQEENSAESIVTAGAMNILSIFATVVAASYLANVINRKDIERAQSDAQKAKKDVATLDVRVKCIRPIVDNNRRIMFHAFLEALDSPTADVASIILARRFRDSYAEFSQSSDDGILYYKLSEIEHLYLQVRERHNSAYGLDESLLQFADIGDKAIDTLQKELKTIDAARDESVLIMAYLANRRASLKFYCGYCEKSRTEGVIAFSRAAVELEQCFSRKFGVEGDDEHRLNAYYENMLGECYSKIAHFYSDTIGKANEFKEMDRLLVEFDGQKVRLGEQIDAIVDRAIMHCKNSVSKYEAIFPKGSTKNDRAAASVYYRDLGCAYERKDRVKTRPTKKCFCVFARRTLTPSANTYAEYKNVVENYLKSLAIICNNLTIQGKYTTNTYYTILAYYRSFWMQQCDFACENCKGICHKESQRLKPLVENMYRVAELAKSEFPRNSRFLYLYGYSCAFAAVMIRDGFEIDLPNKNIQYYIEEVDKALKTAALLDPNNGFRSKLQAALQAISG